METCSLRYHAQGIVLGALLFVIYINDLPDTIESNINLFTDDTKFYTRVEGHRDAIKIQNDLNRLNLWSEKWLLKFHPDTSSVRLIRTIQYGG